MITSEGLLKPMLVSAICILFSNLRTAQKQFKMLLITPTAGWHHEFDGGRSFYTALGHIEKVYENQWF